MTARGLVVNGQEWPPAPRYRRPVEQPAPRVRIFDHLDVRVPWTHEEQERLDLEDAHLSRAARRMRSSEWWHTVPMYEEPRPASGEFRERKHAALAALDELVSMDRDELEAVIAEIEPRKRAALKRLLAAYNT